MNDRHYEYCDHCGAPTGKAGRFDGSIYVTAKQQISCYGYNDSTRYAGDELGPLCDDCYESFRDRKIIEDD